MSYPAEDRHERDRDSLVVSASSSRNTGQEKEKIEKNKVVGAPAGGMFFFSLNFLFSTFQVSSSNV